ncbi:MAG TPA: TetR/AcrR family transcriptional regulator C-terminal domain-containing protein [Thermotogota bacterium]|nr:TetR/AcrR family transcriptional regulator C-terminal domain-containing protein [Thermotogota bacterium]HPJ90070.1 TetR/AcrR family transcriptional regulator C-terminal domain-containing protein [Thermotogota bacterium]HPR96869.1 TetR/AcrR family transcriptional regulator C-terminal domain-containing protein [Thermotogota bacterium]
MSNSQITETAIANALKELTKKKLFKDISIQDIVSECGISRKTFYNHFQDKYQLADWIFKQEIFGKILSTTTIRNWKQGSYDLCHYLNDNRTFYLNLLRFEGQNSLKQYLYDLTDSQIRLLVDELLDGRTISDGDMKFIIEFYYNAFIGTLSVWVEQDMEDSPDNIVERWCGLVDNSLENFIRKFAR